MNWLDPYRDALSPYLYAEWDDGVLLCGDCMDVVPYLPEGGIHLVVTSPPYNIGVKYDGYSDIREGYASWLASALGSIREKMVVGGRICLNLPGHTSNTLNDFNVLKFISALDSIGYNLRTTHVWYKPNHVGSTAWGSWRSPSCPVAQPNHEYIFVLETGYRREDKRGPNDISKEEFIQFIKTTWVMAPHVKYNGSGDNVLGHNAPFPVELPYRCMKLYSWEEDVVFDPFVGSGTTALSAVAMKRYFVVCDISEKACSIAQHRIDDEYAGLAEARQLTLFK